MKAGARGRPVTMYLEASPQRASAPFKESMDGVGEVISPDFCLTIPMRLGEVSDPSFDHRPEKAWSEDKKYVERNKYVEPEINT